LSLIFGANDTNIARQYIWNPVSLAWEAMTGDSDPTSTDVAVTNFPASQAVTGTFWPDIQTVDQNASVSADNSSVTHIHTGASFEGVITSTLGVNAIQVNLFTDQNCTVYVDQSTDTTPNWDIVDSFHYYASTNFGVTVQATSSYFRVRVTNTSSVDTSLFRLQTVLCPIVEALPRSLDDDGNLKVGIKSTKDEYGFEVENTPIGEMRVVNPTRLIGTAFDGTTVDPNFWTATVANSGTVAQATAQIVLSTTTTATNGTARLSSTRRARYLSGSANAYRSVITLSAAAANNKRRWGIAYGSAFPATHTITDGAWFQFDGTTFSVVTAKNSATGTAVNSGDFNGTLGKTYSPGTTVHTYEIYWTNSKVYFVVDGRVLHTITASDSPWCQTMHQYIYMDNVNSNNLQTDHTITCRVASIRRLGGLLSQPASKWQAGTTAGVVLKYGPGNLHGIAVTGVVANSVITLYDNTAASGTVIWASGTLPEITTPFDIPFHGLPFYVGLTLVIATQNSNALVTYE
jgi:hypothetical protein